MQCQANASQIKSSQINVHLLFQSNKNENSTCTKRIHTSIQKEEEKSVLHSDLLVVVDEWSKEKIRNFFSQFSKCLPRKRNENMFRITNKNCVNLLKLV